MTSIHNRGATPCNTSNNTDNSNNGGAPFTIDIAQPEHLPQSQPGPSSVVHGATARFKLGSPLVTYDAHPKPDYFQHPWGETSAIISETPNNDDGPIKTEPSQPAQVRQSQLGPSSIVHDAKESVNLNSHVF